jgi:hypothetical protein
MRREAEARRGQLGAVPARLAFGLLVMALGFLFLGANLGYFSARQAFRLFWPSAFVVLGLVVLFEPRSRTGRRLWGLAWIAAGGWIWSYQEGWIDVDLWDLLVPLALVLFGVSLVWRSLRGPRRRRAESDDPDAEVRSFALLSGNQVRSTSAEFRSADLGALMGGVELDLTQAKPAGDEAEIDVFAMWGGIEIRVPREWTVVSKVMPVMGAFEDKTEPLAGASRRLVVRGFVVMGGVEVKN